MITRNTVIVLGAGASCPYGLPLGADLRKRILGMTEDQLRGLPTPPEGRDVSLPRTFQEAFRQSRAYSIDAFLARRPEFAHLGRHAIAASLLPCESVEQLLRREPEDDWYSYLAHAMDAPWDEYQQNKISFITFNYDRSLELCLVSMLQHRYGKTEAEAFDMLSHFPIVHVYGSLGNVRPGQPDFVPYGGSGDTYIRIAAKGLRVIAEGRDDSPEFQEARRLIADADALCFLGFSFDPMNVDRLGGRSIGAGWKELDGGRGRTKPFAATAYGMTSAEVKDAANRISGGGSPIPLEPSMMNMPSLRLLRETGILR